MSTDTESRVVEPNKGILELIKTILEQNRIILLTNKMMLEYLSAPPIVYHSK